MAYKNCFLHSQTKLKTILVESKQELTGILLALKENVPTCLDQLEEMAYCHLLLPTAIIGGFSDCVSNTQFWILTCHSLFFSSKTVLMVNLPFL